jgi:ubiquinone/menaquinone biosynthesis C-methylase UbiE
MDVESGEKASSRSHWEMFWHDKQDVNEVYSNADRIVRNLSHVTDLKGKRILEIGAGTGRDSFPLVAYGAKIVQLDYSENSLLILNNLAKERHLSVGIVGGDAFRLPFRDNTFDVVFHQGLLEHFRKREAEELLKENIRVVKPGGFLLVDVPQRYHLYTLAKHLLIFMNLWFAGWERSFSVVELRALLQRLGVAPFYSYGEWMYPSFFYRVAREIFKKIGVQLPLAPKPLKLLSHLRANIRQSLLGTSLPLYTGISIGVVARKFRP